MLDMLAASFVPAFSSKPLFVSEWEAIVSQAAPQSAIPPLSPPHMALPYTQCLQQRHTQYHNGPRSQRAIGYGGGELPVLVLQVHECPQDVDQDREVLDAVHESDSLTTTWCSSVAKLML